MNATHLLVLAKEPVAGRVKTRLAAAYGADRAATIYRELTAVTLAHARAARASGTVDAIELWCSPSPATAWFRSLARDSGATLHAQTDGADLGIRMRDAIADALTRSPYVLLIGTDCPSLDEEVLAQARAALTTHDAVLGPAEDGGFVLVGARRLVTFGAVRWSTPHAFTDAAAAFTQSGIPWTTLPVSWDVDEPADFVRWDAARKSAATAAS